MEIYDFGALKQMRGNRSIATAGFRDEKVARFVRILND